MGDRVNQVRRMSKVNLPTNLHELLTCPLSARHNAKIVVWCV
jgi:hypothetical protein